MDASRAPQAAARPPQSAAVARVVSLFRAVEGCSHAMRAALDRIASGHGMNATQLLALWACGEASLGVGQSDLADEIGVSPAQASALVEQLRRRSLIESQRDAADRRRQRWTITEGGRTILLALADALADLAGRMDEGLPDAECDQLARALRRLSDAACDAAPAAATTGRPPRLRVIWPPPQKADQTIIGPDDSAGAAPAPTPREVRR